jgi:BirA family transcriptional regulator, biotin operon repressor / biotin---[acetyl-CoA-carboxylase] ligase
VIEQAQVRHYATIDSTNLEAHRLFATGQREPLFLLADEQTAGKGRLDRNWASLRGNCYSTLVLPLHTSVSTVPQIGFVTALAVADLVRGLSKAEPKLKWPNDVLVQGAKIAGILSEVLSIAPLTIAIGCGINVAHAPVGLAYPATCLNAEGAHLDRDTVFQAYRKALAQRINIWDNGLGFATIRAAWVQQAIGIGEIATMTIGTQHLTGTFEGLTEQGAVVLKPADGPPYILHAGDLHIPSLARLRNGNP